MTFRPTLLLVAAFIVAAVPLSSQTEQKPSFEVVSVKPSPPMGSGPIRVGGGPQGDRFVMASATLRMLLQTAYQRASNTPLSGQMQIIGGPGWMESDRYDVQARADCSGGAIPREQLQLMVQSLLEDRFQLKAHMETRELPIYNLVVAKDGPKVKASDDQTPPFAAATLPRPCDSTSTPAAPPAPPPPPPGGRGFPFDPGSPPPRGAMMMMSSPTGMTLQATAMPFANLVAALQQQLGRTVVDKTDLKGLVDFKLTYSPEGLSNPFGRGGLPPPPGAAPAGPSPVPTAADPVPSIFTAIQELGLRLESSKGPVDVLVIESVQKPTEN